MIVDNDDEILESTYFSMSENMSSDLTSFIDKASFSSILESTYFNTSDDVFSILTIGVNEASFLSTCSRICSEICFQISSS